MDTSAYNTPHTMLYSLSKTLSLCNRTLFLIIPSDIITITITITTFAQRCKIGSNETHVNPCKHSFSRQASTKPQAQP